MERALRPRNIDSVAKLRLLGGRMGCWHSIMHGHDVSRSVLAKILSVRKACDG